MVFYAIPTKSNTDRLTFPMSIWSSPYTSLSITKLCLNIIGDNKIVISDIASLSFSETIFIWDSTYIEFISRDGTNPFIWLSRIKPSGKCRITIRISIIEPVIIISGDICCCFIFDSITSKEFRIIFKLWYCIIYESTSSIKYINIVTWLILTFKIKAPQATRIIYNIR